MPAERPDREEEEREEEEREEDDEEAEEEREEWSELIPVEELEQQEDGPSTLFIGGFSTCTSLSEAISRLQYTQDCIRVFPGLYKDDAEVVLEEAKLRNTHIQGVPFARGKAAGYPTAKMEEQLVKAGKRVGPWFTYAAAAASLAAESSGQMPPAQQDNMTMSSLVYGGTVTPTQPDPAHYPVFTGKWTLRYSYQNKAEITPLRAYKQAADDEEEREDEEGEGNGGQPQDDDDADSTGEGEGAAKKKKVVDTVLLEGLCVLGGLVCEPLTRGKLLHCVVGSPAGGTAAAPTMVLTHALSEVLLSRCLLYGGTSHVVYAYPRSQVTLRGCLLDGPLPAAQLQRQVAASRASRHSAGWVELLQHRSRQRAAVEAAANAGASAATVDLERLATFVAPAETLCQVGLYADDADVQVQDCMISNVQLGLLLHDKCQGTRVLASDVRGVQQVGAYLYGVGGAAKLQQCTARACGREALLVLGPTPQEEAAARQQQQQPPAHVPAAEWDDKDDEAGGAEVLAQHPLVQRCIFTGAVRLQGNVRCGAMVDNLVYRPKSSAYTAANIVHFALTQSSAESNDNVAWATRGFELRGVEGQPATAQ